MKFRVLLKESARDGATKAFLYYESVQLGLGDRFLDKLELTLNEIGKHPKIYKKKYKHFRQSVVKPFPYLVIFVIDGNDVVVYKVINAKSNPSKHFKI